MSTKSIPFDIQKTALLSDFRATRADILGEAARIPPERVVTPFVGTWNILDLLAHLRGWDFTNLQAAKEILRGQLPAFYAERDKGWVSYNAQLVMKHRRDNLEAMIAAVEASQAELVNFLERLSPSELLQDQGVRLGSYKVIIARLIRAEIKDERIHLDQIRTFMVG